jgi:predicted DCC family thiol-disulfide oxidoreductase YuxK
MNFRSMSVFLSHAYAFSGSRNKGFHSLWRRASSHSKLSSHDQRLFSEELNILYDSKCNVCEWEINFLRQRDIKLHGSSQARLRFTDLESEKYDETDPANGNIDYETGMKAIHAITPEGKVLIGVPVFEQAYQKVGLGWLFVMTKIPFLKIILDLGYDIFARYRTRITRGETIPDLVEAYRQRKLKIEKDNDCRICSGKL